MNNEELKKKIEDLLCSSDEECVELAKSIIFTYFPKDLEVLNHVKNSSQLACSTILYNFAILSVSGYYKPLVYKQILQNFDILLKYNETNC